MFLEPSEVLRCAFKLLSGKIVKCKSACIVFALVVWPGTVSTQRSFCGSCMQQDTSILAPADLFVECSLVGQFPGSCACKPLNLAPLKVFVGLLAVHHTNVLCPWSMHMHAIAVQNLAGGGCRS